MKLLDGTLISGALQRLQSRVAFLSQRLFLLVKLSQLLLDIRRDIVVAGRKLERALVWLDGYTVTRRKAIPCRLLVGRKNRVESHLQILGIRHPLNLLVVARQLTVNLVKLGNIRNTWQTPERCRIAHSSYLQNRVLVGLESIKLRLRLVSFARGPFRKVDHLVANDRPVNNRIIDYLCGPSGCKRQG